jgi:hypothetical protein
VLGSELTFVQVLRRERYFGDCSILVRLGTHVQDGEGAGQPH